MKLKRIKAALQYVCSFGALGRVKESMISILNPTPCFDFPFLLECCHTSDVSQINKNIYVISKNPPSPWLLLSRCSVSSQQEHDGKRC